MYSLILMDDVVKAVDRMAFENGLSRSALINQILAEHLSLVTPQMRITNIFEHVTRVAAKHRDLQVQPLASGNMLVMKSVIQYKYNPTLRYSVELSMHNGVYTGEFKVVSRSQSEALLSRLNIFYEMWAQIEDMALGKELSKHQLKFSMEGGKFRRTLSVQRESELEDTRLVGEAIGNYVGTFDDILNTYFGAADDVKINEFEKMQEMYKEYLSWTPLII